jgi:glycosyltransferase involved in cell wall biosynthesis
VIPAYNRAKTIRYCLDSVLAQTLTPLEVIVVDDCSTDDTVRIVQEYPDPRVRCLPGETNAGAQVARNRGIREAKGDWIAFQDSDDEWLPEKLEKQVDLLSDTGFDPWTVVHTNAIWLDIATGEKLPVDLPVVEGKDVYAQLLTAPAPLFPTLLVSRLALEKIGLLDEKAPCYQEWDTSIRLAQYCRFCYIREPLFVYHLHQGETISKNLNKEIWGYQYIIGKFEQEIRRVCGDDVWEWHLFNQVEKCLNYKLWAEAAIFLDMLPAASLKRQALSWCRRLRLSPQFLRRIKKTFVR